MDKRQETIVDKVCKRYEKLKGLRGTWETHWQQIADLMHPFNDNFITHESPGTEKMQAVFDSTPQMANQLLASGLYSMLTSPAQQWYEYRPTDIRLMDNRDIALWFDEATKISFFERNKPTARFNTAIHECYLEYGAFGNLVLFPQEHVSRNGLFYQSLALSESYLEEGAEGYVNVLFRRYPRTVRQLVGKFGIKNVSEKVAKHYEDGEYQRVIKCIHAIFPSVECTEVNQRYPFTSLYIDKKYKHLMLEGFYYELPFMAARFYKSPHEIYGRGPGSIALPDIKMLNEIMRTTLRAAQKVTDPPLMVPDDGFLAPIRTTPGGLNFYRSGFGDRVEPMDFGTNPDVGFDIIDRLYSRIREIFFVDQLQLQEGPQMTATEVLQRTEEKLRLMGPLFGRLKPELLGPCLLRDFNILLRQRKFPPVPQDFLRYISTPGNVKISYISPIARAQEQTEANGIMRAMSVLTPFLEMKPEIMDNYNVDELARGVNEMFSVSTKYLHSQEEVRATRTQRSQQEQQAQIAENVGKAGPGIDAMSRAAQNLQVITGGEQ